MSALRGQSGGASTRFCGRGRWGPHQKGRRSPVEFRPMGPSLCAILISGDLFMVRFSISGDLFMVRFSISGDLFMVRFSISGDLFMVRFSISGDLFMVPAPPYWMRMPSAHAGETLSAIHLRMPA
eukprot:scaffold870_cov108-Isochrysis_galbana.AAC.3